MTMTPEAKRTLSATIRSLRTRLLDDLHASTEGAYRLSVRARDAGLGEAARTKRARLEAWLDEQRRAHVAAHGSTSRTAADFRAEAEKQAAYTLLNRLIILRLMEAPSPGGEPLRSPSVATGGWSSKGYADFRQLAPALVRDDETEGYAFLLGLVFEDLATELPGLYGPAGVADLVPIPASTLRHVIEALDDPDLATCWTDDMTLGWVYQYWNDPEREAIDAKLNAGGKVQPHEIASKTQMFTERYMVDWLLQNSLGPMWLAICKKHGWTPDVQADGTLDRLEQRRIEWRAKRDAGEVTLTDLMPLHTEAERRWAYYVPQPLPDDAVEHAPESVRDLKIIDPAVGSGHFLVVALDLLVALFREEARHRGLADAAEWSDQAIVERILGDVLHGIDLDPRAVQIAAAALWLKARHVAREARPERLNLVASNLRLASLPDDDPALVELRSQVERETGVPAALTDTIIHALRGADHLGSLLKVDRAVDEAIEAHERAVTARFDEERQAHLFGGGPPPQAKIDFEAAQARRTLLDRLEEFLAHHSSGDDLGLRLRGEQLAAGVRFLRLVQEGQYDLVVANPPYQGTSKMADSEYVATQYRLGKADLYAAFLLRGLDLVRWGGTSAMLTMRNWMFVKQHAELREHLLSATHLAALGDFDRGAFESVADEIVSVAVVILRKLRTDPTGIALCPTPRDDRSRDSDRTARKRAATLSQMGRHSFDTRALMVVPEWPLVYWWPQSLLDSYARAQKVGDSWLLRKGLTTCNNSRFVRRVWEVAISTVHAVPAAAGESISVSELFRCDGWVPWIDGSEGRQWRHELESVVLWSHRGLEIAAAPISRYGRGEDVYFRPGIAFTMIGNVFRARRHAYLSIIGNMGASIYGPGLPELTCTLNSARARFVLQSLNPTAHFETLDVKRLAAWPSDQAADVDATIDRAFHAHESHREPSVEFLRPGPSSWRHAQVWAQLAVDRPEGAPLPPYEADLDREAPADHLSFSLGVALGRFGRNGEGILNPAMADFSHALPHGILFLDCTLDAGDHRDGLGHPACAMLCESWSQYGESIETNRSNLREWLALDFFKDVHRGMYENRPIHWPLSSKDRTFVAWITIHRWTEQTLRVLLADHLHPTLGHLDGQITDLRNARDSADKKAARAAERRYAQVAKAREELATFIADVEQCADRGPSPPDGTCPPREQDARYAPNLDDGVMINSAALWKLLEPQWKDPKKWWKELATASGRKDYDWSHLAMRYWPKRVDAKCQADPSLAVAHGCFWRYHPARAWAWELRLQDEIAPDFRIEESPYRPGGRELGDHGDGPHRDTFLRDEAQRALAAVEKEAERRIGRGRKWKVVAEMRLLESGLWSALPEYAWAMELRLSERQGAEFFLRAPDEPVARSAFEAAHPAKVAERREFIAALVPETSLFSAEGENDDEDPESDEADVDEVAAVEEDDS